jgi:pyruvate,water dikinase
MTAVYGNTQFEFDEKRDLEHSGAWFCDVTHGSPPWKPLYLLHSWLWPGYRSIQRAYEYLSVPTSKGWDIRLKDGYPYPTVILTSPEDAMKRALVFRDRIRPYIEDAAGLWDKRKLELLDAYQDLKQKYGLATYESIANLSNIELLELFEDYQSVNTTQWNVHMDFFVPVFSLFGLFEQMCRDLLAIDHSDPLFAKVMSGFDGSVFEFNREIWRLGKRAVDLKLGPIVCGTDDGETIIASLGTSDAGRQWLADYRTFLNVYGWRCDRMLDWSTPTWLEEPSLGIPAIKLAVGSGGDSTINTRREQAKIERGQAEKELLARVSVDHRYWFEALMKAAQVAGYWSEDHNYYCDLYAAALGRWITKEIGRRFANAGVIEDSEDIYFLVLADIYRAFIPMGKVKLQDRVEARRQEWERYLTITPTMLIGDPEVMREMASKDPVLGASFALPNVRKDIQADLYGGGSAPGVAEGLARVIMTEKEMGELQPGEILVSPGTSSQWAPAFEIIKGIITDGGGALSHAVILAREYGIPAVTGCQQGTRMIRTGDRVRVDGDLGLVFIDRLSKPQSSD